MRRVGRLQLRRSGSPVNQAVELLLFLLEKKGDGSPNVSKCIYLDISTHMHIYIYICRYRIACLHNRYRGCIEGYPPGN